MKHSRAHPKIFSEKGYEGIIQRVGSAHYQVFDQHGPLPPGIFSKQPEWDLFNCVVAASGSTLQDYCFSYKTVDQSSQYSTQDFVVPSDSEIVVVRFLRYDKTHGSPHYNADDQIIFPTKQGNIFRISRNDAPDHYLSIVDNSTVADIAKAYKLPEEKSGPIGSYAAKGASFPIELSPARDD